MARVKGELTRLLAEKALDGLPDLTDREPAALRKLYGLLFDQDELIAWRAALGFGVLARERPERVRRTLSRLAYALNDEASTCAWMTGPAVAAMAAANPRLTRNVVRIVVHYFEDEETSHSANRNVRVLCSSLWAVGEVGSVQPELAREALSTLWTFTRDPEPQVRGHAWWALGRARLPGPDADDGGAAADHAPARVFDPDCADLIHRSVGWFAAWAKERAVS